MKNAINFSKDDFGTTALLTAMLFTIAAGLFSANNAAADQAPTATPTIETIVVTATKLK
jgi:hypothetical protein